LWWGRKRDAPQFYLRSSLRLFSFFFLTRLMSLDIQMRIFVRVLNQIIHGQFFAIRMIFSSHLDFLDGVCVTTVVYNSNAYEVKFWDWTHYSILTDLIEFARMTNATTKRHISTWNIQTNSVITITAITNSRLKRPKYCHFLVPNDLLIHKFSRL